MPLNISFGLKHQELLYTPHPSTKASSDRVYHIFFPFTYVFAHADNIQVFFLLLNVRMYIICVQDFVCVVLVVAWTKC